jgi:hypothetical protein
VLSYRHSLILYAIFAFFPGCLLSYFIQFSFLNDDTSSVIPGLLSVLFPYFLLALLLLVITRLPTNNYSPPILLLFLGTVSLLLTILSAVGFITSTKQVIQIYIGERAYSEGAVGGNPFALQMASAWMGGCFLGFTALLFVYPVLWWRSSNQKTDTDVP